MQLREQDYKELLRFVIGAGKKSSSEYEIFNAWVDHTGHHLTDYQEVEYVLDYIRRAMKLDADICRDLGLI